MARSATSIAIVAFIAACFLAPAAFRNADAAVSCGQVASSLGQCMNYIRGRAQLSALCCRGVKALNAAARSTPDRRAACTCLKTISGRIPNIQTRLAAGLPGRCGVSIPYPISTSTDCSKVR